MHLEVDLGAPDCPERDDPGEEGEEGDAGAGGTLVSHRRLLGRRDRTWGVPVTICALLADLEPEPSGLVDITDWPTPQPGEPIGIYSAVARVHPSPPTAAVDQT